MATASVTAARRCKIVAVVRVTVETSSVSAIRHERHIGHVADIDRAAVAGGQSQVADLFGRRSVSPATSSICSPRIADPASRKGACWRPHLAGQLLQRDAIQRQPFRVGRDAQRLAGFADQIGQADIVILASSTAARGRSASGRWR